MYKRFYSKVVKLTSETIKSKFDGILSLYKENGLIHNNAMQQTGKELLNSSNYDQKTCASIANVPGGLHPGKKLEQGRGGLFQEISQNFSSENRLSVCFLWAENWDLGEEK